MPIGKIIDIISDLILSPKIVSLLERKELLAAGILIITATGYTINYVIQQAKINPPIGKVRSTFFPNLQFTYYETPQYTYGFAFSKIQFIDKKLLFSEQYVKYISDGKEKTFAFVIRLDKEIKKLEGKFQISSTKFPIRYSAFFYCGLFLQGNLTRMQNTNVTETYIVECGKPSRIVTLKFKIWAPKGATVEFKNRILKIILKDGTILSPDKLEKVLKEKIINNYKRGLSIKEIAEKYGVSEEYIREILKEEGVKETKLEGYNEVNLGNNKTVLYDVREFEVRVPIFENISSVEGYVQLSYIVNGTANETTLLMIGNTMKEIEKRIINNDIIKENLTLNETLGKPIYVSYIILRKKYDKPVNVTLIGPVNYTIIYNITGSITQELIINDYIKEFKVGFNLNKKGLEVGGTIILDYNTKFNGTILERSVVLVNDLKVTKKERKIADGYLHDSINFRKQFNEETLIRTINIKKEFEKEIYVGKVKGTLNYYVIAKKEGSSNEITIPSKIPPQENITTEREINDYVKNFTITFDIKQEIKGIGGNVILQYSTKFEGLAKQTVYIYLDDELILKKEKTISKGIILDEIPFEKVFDKSTFIDKLKVKVEFEKEIYVGKVKGTLNYYVIKSDKEEREINDYVKNFTLPFNINEEGKGILGVVNVTYDTSFSGVVKETTRLFVDEIKVIENNRTIWEGLLEDSLSFSKVFNSKKLIKNVFLKKEFEKEIYVGKVTGTIDYIIIKRDIPGTRIVLGKKVGLWLKDFTIEASLAYKIDKKVNEKTYVEVISNGKTIYKKEISERIVEGEIEDKIIEEIKLKEESRIDEIRIIKEFSYPISFSIENFEMTIYYVSKEGNVYKIDLPLNLKGITGIKGNLTIIFDTDKIVKEEVVLQLLNETNIIYEVKNPEKTANKGRNEETFLINVRITPSNITLLRVLLKFNDTVNLWSVAVKQKLEFYGPVDLLKYKEDLCKIYLSKDLPDELKIKTISAYLKEKEGKTVPEDLLKEKLYEICIKIRCREFNVTHAINETIKLFGDKCCSILQSGTLSSDEKKKICIENWIKPYSEKWKFYFDIGCIKEEVFFDKAYDGIVRYCESKKFKEITELQNIIENLAQMNITLPEEILYTTNCTAEDSEVLKWKDLYVKIIRGLVKLCKTGVFNPQNTQEQQIRLYIFTSLPTVEYKCIGGLCFRYTTTLAPVLTDTITTCSSIREDIILKCEESEEACFDTAVTTSVINKIFSGICYAIEKYKVPIYIGLARDYGPFEVGGMSYGPYTLLYLIPEKVNTTIEDLCRKCYTPTELERSNKTRIVKEEVGKMEHQIISKCKETADKLKEVANDVCQKAYEYCKAVESKITNGEVDSAFYEECKVFVGGAADVLARTALAHADEVYRTFLEAADSITYSTCSTVAAFIAGAHISVFGYSIGIPEGVAPFVRDACYYGAKGAFVMRIKPRIDDLYARIKRFIQECVLKGTDCCKLYIKWYDQQLQKQQT